ncbi:MAG: type II toxin-antitoxin system RelE/ParE family toxin [Methylocystis sp.]|nr:type II toxin-antitoxin system RelE/ParE family toxin [Methylocystis sp.]
MIAVVETPAYLSRAERLLSESERAEIVDMLAANPKIGVLIRDAGGLRKARIGFHGRGKRGGGRVIYWFHSESFPVVLLWMFAKNEASDLTSDQRRSLAREAEALVQDFGGAK